MRRRTPCAYGGEQYEVDDAKQGTSQLVRGRTLTPGAESEDQHNRAQENQPWQGDGKRSVDRMHAGENEHAPMMVRYAE